MAAEVKKDISQEKIYTGTIPIINSQIKDFIQRAIIVYIIHMCGKAMCRRGFKLLLFIHNGITQPFVVSEDHLSIYGLYLASSPLLLSVFIC